MRELPHRQRLQLILGEAKFSLEPDRVYRVGRGEAYDLNLNHASVGDPHCEIRLTEEGLEVTDMQSEHGTRVGDKLVYKAVLQAGESMMLGDIAVGVERTGLTVPISGRGGHAIRHREQAAFTDFMAEELRRAPWFTLSAMIHVLVFLLLYVLLEPGGEATHGIQAIAVAQQDEAEEVIEERDQAPAEEPVVEELTNEIELQNQLEQDSFQAPEPSDFVPFEDTSPAALESGSHWLTNVKGRSRGILGEAGVGGSGFRKRVTEIRRSGLEIVFVFDSTGSMSSVLDGTKRRIADMVEALHALVPDARVGLVTYRDTDVEEDYLTRSIPLSNDLYRAINFMQVIEADGGGDEEEAVLEGLLAALRQSWKPRAQRVVVLIGDAPAHSYDDRRIKSALKTFASDGRSFVHSIVTSRRGRRRLPTNTVDSFAKIAGYGAGKCVGFEDESRILQQVLSLAFGTEYRRNLDEVSRLVTERRETIDTMYLDMVHREAVDEILDLLRKAPVPDDLVKALSRTKSKVVANLLVDVLARRSFSEAGRQAAAYALQQRLGLSQPPNDPENGGRLDGRTAEALRVLVEQRL